MLLHAVTIVGMRYERRLDGEVPWSCVQVIVKDESWPVVDEWQVAFESALWTVCVAAVVSVEAISGVSLPVTSYSLPLLMLSPLP